MTADMTDYDPVAAVTTQLADGGYRVTRAAGGWTAQCPAHDDRNPSLSVAAGDDGRALLHCHAGCSPRDILDALGLDPQQLFTDYDPQREPSQGITHISAWRRKPDPAPKPAKPTRRSKTCHWDYHDADGTLAARVVRYDLIDKDTGEIVGKTFTQHAAEPDGTLLPNLAGRDIPIYGLPLVRAAILCGKPIYICEGERDADTARALGHTATTCPQGAGSWRPHHTAQLVGASRAIVVSDNDEPGRRHARHVAAELRAAGINTIICAPDDGHKDLTEHIAAGGDMNLIVIDDTEPSRDDGDTIRDKFPAIDWAQLWDDNTEEEWIIEPVLPARRLIALYSAPKVGKSLLMLEIAAAVSRGSHVLGYTPARPHRVLYVDFENDPRTDTRDRLKSMGYTPDDLDNLVMLSFPNIAALDTQGGADELLACIGAYSCEVVVIDTVSRSIRGEENENDTWLNFYRHTGLALKQAGVALIRLDHTGKDESKGQRGGSAKSGDVDAIWRLSKVSDAVFRLDCEAARLPIAEKTLVLHRETSPRLRHRVDAAGAAAAWKVKVDELIGLLDDNQVPDDASVRDVRAWKNGRGLKASNQVIEEAVRVRKARLGAFEVDR